MSVKKLPSFACLSPNDMGELLRFEKYLQRRSQRPDEPLFVTYGEEYGEAVLDHTAECAAKKGGERA